MNTHTTEDGRIYINAMTSEVIEELDKQNITTPRIKLILNVDEVESAVDFSTEFYQRARLDILKRVFDIAQASHFKKTNTNTILGKKFNYRFEPCLDTSIQQ